MDSDLQLVDKRSERGHLHQGVQTDIEQGRGEIQSGTDMGQVNQFTDHVT